MVPINQMIASSKSTSCLVPFDYKKYGGSSFKSWTEENSKLSSNPCKLMSAFQEGLEKLASDFACLDGIPGKKRLIL